MPNYAIVKNGVVDNITSASNEFGESMGWILVDNSVQIGYIHNPTNKTFSPFIDTARDLADAKAKKNIEINESRLKANFDSFTFKGKQIATDQLSRSDIDGTNGTVALTGNFPEGWPGAWKAKDDTYVIIENVEEWTAFYLAFCAQGTINFAKAQQLKESVKKAETIKDLESIKW